jgi:beta-lactamase superfamily II metal-dependent hydrolase
VIGIDMTKYALVVILLAAAFQPSSKSLETYFIDAEGGGATLFVSPSGESLLIDAGNPGDRDAGRIAAVAQQAGVKRIDYFIATHYHVDHVGGIPDLTKRIPIATFVDHGSEIHDQSKFRGSDAMFNGYLTARGQGRHLQVKPGDKVPINGLDVVVVSSDGAAIKSPLPGGGAPNPLCRDFTPQDADVSENARSIGVVIRNGRFSLLAMGDLTWNKEQELVCPNNLLGPIDVYLTTHHGLNLSGPRVLVHAIAPRVAIMNNGPRKGASREAWTTVKSSPGLEDLWQLHYAVQRPGNVMFNERGDSGGSELNVAEPLIANIDEDGAHAPAHFIKVSARDDGSFTVANSRNGHTRSYRSR